MLLEVGCHNGGHIHRMTRRKITANKLTFFTVDIWIVPLKQIEYKTRWWLGQFEKGV